MNNKHFIGLLLLVTLTSCGVHRTLPTDTPWQTARVTNASITAEWDGERMQMGCNLYAIRDSVIILSAVPLLGMEVARIEVRPTEILLIDKMNRRYVTVGWKEQGQLTGHKLKWNQVINLLFPTSPINPTSLQRQCTIQGHTLTLELQYTTPKWNEPITIRPINTDTYQPMTLLDLLVLL